MPRAARIKPADIGAYYHLMNRIAGESGQYPLGDVEKAKFVSLLKEATRFFTVEVIGFHIMGNHWHVVCFAPADVLSAVDTAARYNRFYDGRKPVLDPADGRCLRIARNLRDIGCFIGWVQQRFTSWFNRTRTPRRRRGTLWADRFKSIPLQRDTALWECLCYIEMNAARAGIVQDPAEYRFGSWGEWCATGQHPFAENLLRHLPAYEGTQARATTLDGIQAEFRVELARRQVLMAGGSEADVDAAMDAAARPPGFVLRLDRRVRYWTDGLAIGSKAFVQEMAARVYGTEAVMRHRLQRATRHGIATDLWAYRRLNAIPA
ncbi:MAG: hypothetical protein A3K19_33895 [Lentisphaerae bacterium RIFOXYB12_FULL_65_16]|nr:MAG: hypothetical protein A3K19_33895 [Lentisphaerae bacterium RIFOXYB12_FULL_65_16]